MFTCRTALAARTVQVLSHERIHMSADHTRRVRRAALKLLSEIGPEPNPEELRVQVEYGDHFSLRLVGTAEDLSPESEQMPALPARPEGVRPDALWLSEPDAAILAALPETGRISTRDLAAKLKVRPDGDIRLRLKILRERRIIGGEHGQGYWRLT